MKQKRFWCEGWSSGNKILGCGSLALLPLELLHVELKLFAFQDISVANPFKITIRGGKFNIPKGKFAYRKEPLITCYKICRQKRKCRNVTYPSARPHWPGRDEIQANKRPPLNCSSICASSWRFCWRFSSFLWTWLLFFTSSVAAAAAGAAASPSY